MRGQSDREIIQIERVADSIDGSILENERHVALDARSRNAVLLRQISEALKRIVSDAYGLCLECGEPIRESRLSALPWARLCLRCQEEDETRYRAGGPVMGPELSDAA